MWNIWIKRTNVLAKEWHWSMAVKQLREISVLEFLERRIDCLPYLVCMFFIDIFFWWRKDSLHSLLQNRRHCSYACSKVDFTIPLWYSEINFPETIKESTTQVLKSTLKYFFKIAKMWMVLYKKAIIYLRKCIWEKYIKATHRWNYSFSVCVCYVLCWSCDLRNSYLCTQLFG